MVKVNGVIFGFEKGGERLLMLGEGRCRWGFIGLGATNHTD